MDLRTILYKPLDKLKSIFMVQNKLLPEWLNPESASYLTLYVTTVTNTVNHQHRLMKENFDQYVEFESASRPKKAIESIRVLMIQK